MKKAIATPPGQPTEYRDLTTTEASDRAAEEAAYLAAKPMREWQEGMAVDEIPRWAEDMIGAMDAPMRARIPAPTLDKYNAKVVQRGKKPK